MKIFVDIDDTIADYDILADKTDYTQARPIWINIDKINELYDDGHKITYYTARGSETGIDWYNITLHQLKDWGCKYHKLITGHKPAYDLMICDKTKRIEEI